ncbi:MAG: hypothetical protein WC782_11350 [Methylococcaceae bacterium]|jgi:hypothetical protein
MNTKKEFLPNVSKTSLYIIVLVLAFSNIFQLATNAQAVTPAVTSEKAKPPMTPATDDKSKQTVFNISYLTDRTAVIKDVYGKILLTTKPIEPHKGDLKGMDMMGIAIMEKHEAIKSTSLLDGVINTAEAGINGQYYDYVYNYGDGTICLRYTYPGFMFVGVCP